MTTTDDYQIPELYLKGFNDGYLLAKVNPELLTQLIQGNQSKTSEYFKGLVSGKKELEKELSLAKLASKLESAKDITKSKDKGLEREL